MSIVVPQYRVLLDDTNSVAPNLARSLMQIVQPQISVFWNLMPFGETLTQLKYDVGSRSISPREVVLAAQILTGDTSITLSAGTKLRVTTGHLLYDPTTGERFVLGSINQTSGVAQIRKRGLFSKIGAVAATIPNATKLYILSQSEFYEGINADSRFEDTSFVTNYVQDMTELLKFSTADLREIRRWPITKQLRLTERMRDIMKDLNLSVIYNVPVAPSGTDTAVTAGFDYVVEQAGSVVNAGTSGTADFADLRGVMKTLQKNGVGPGDGLAAMMSVNTFHAYEDEGLAEIRLEGTPGAEFVLGGVVKGMNFNGLGFVPFYADPFINDDRVRFVTTSQCRKAYYKGGGENTVLEEARVIDEPSKSDSKNQVSSLQQKWGTQIDNGDKVHYILDKTGLN